MSNELTKIPKFRRCVLQNFPFIEQDFDALTDYQLLCKVVEYLNKVISSQNEVIDITESLSLAFNELQSFVENYFDNLDVQNEINNKLDEMAEDGTLQEIIAAYLQANVTWTFDTVADMKSATNLVAGSYAQTLGFRTLNDGGGAIYHISDTGTANEMDIIAVGNLRAHLSFSKSVTPEMVGAYGDGVADDTSYFAKAVEIATNVICDKIYKISSITIPNGKKICGLGTLIPTSVTVGADTIIKDLTINVGENTTAFFINNLASTSNNNDVFDSLTFNCTTGSVCFHIYPQHTNNGLYNVRFNNITAKGDYLYFLHVTTNSKWVTNISLNNIYAGSPVNVFLLDNNVNQASYCGLTMFNVKSQANTNTQHYMVCDACNVQMRGCNADELQDFNYRLIYIRNAKANILVDGISNANKLVGSSLYNDYTALAANITLTPTLTQVQTNRFNQTTLTEVSNAGTCNGNLVIGVGSMSALTVNSKRILGIQLTPGNRMATDGRSFLLGVDNNGIPYYASVSGNEYHEIPYTGKLKTYSTANRPATANNGDCIFDTTLKQPIYWYGKWLKYDGTDA